MAVPTPFNTVELKLVPYLRQCRRDKRLRPGDEIFTTAFVGIDLPLCFNVTRAKREAPKRPLIAIPLSHMAFLAHTYVYDLLPEHEPDPTLPGICACVWSPLEGQGVLLLIDGTHRCMRSLRVRQPYLAHVLSVAQSYACLLVAPDAVWAHRHKCADPVTGEGA